MALAVVTGATGFVGTHLVAHLRALRWQVIAIARRSSQCAALEALGADIAYADIIEKSAVLRAVPAAPDVIFHLAAAPFGVGLKPDYITRVNEDGLRNSLFAAVERKATCVVYLSDSVVYGEQAGWITDKSQFADPAALPGSYARSKRECEAILGRAVARGLDAVSVVPNFVLGYGLRHYRARYFLDMLQADQVVPPQGSQCFLDIKSLVSALMAAAERGMTGQRYLIGGAPQSWATILEQFAAVNNISTTIAESRGLSRLVRGSMKAVRSMVSGGDEDDEEVAWLFGLNQQISATLAEAHLGYADVGFDRALTELYGSLSAS